MELVKKMRGSIADQIELENTIARAKQLEARLEYVAMMADVDIDIDPEEAPEEEDVRLLLHNRRPKYV